MRAAKSLFLVAALAAAAFGACVDSAVTGNFDDPADGDVDITQDTGGEVADDADSTPIDVPDGIDAGCTTHDQCVSVLGALSPCQAALCDATRGVCFAGRKADCCETVTDCQGTTDPCVAVTCPTPGGACGTIDSCGPCQLDNDCQAVAPPCTQGRCDERGECSFDRLDNCCVSPADCDDGDLCTSKRCTAGVCAYSDLAAPGCCTAPKVIATDFTNPPPFDATSTSATVRWSGIDFDFAPSPPRVLYLGNPSTYNLLSTVPVRAEAIFRLGPVVAGQRVEVKFRLYLDAGPNPPLSIALRYGNGEQIVMWSAGVAPDSTWYPVKASLPIPRGGQAQLVLRYQAGSVTTDSSQLGVLLDDLEARTACGNDGCQNDFQCVADDPCVVGRCGSDGGCRYEDIPNCCHSAFECPPPPGCFNATCQDNRCGVAPRPSCCQVDDDCGPSPDPCFLASRCLQQTCTLVPRPLPCADDDPCTLDFCGPDGQCQHVPDPTAPNCFPQCQNNFQCADGDPCTQDRCTPQGVCTHQPDPNLPGCGQQCQNDAQCGDGDICTLDRCTPLGVCVHLPDPNIPGCSPACQSNFQCQDGDPCTQDRCTPQGVCTHQFNPNFPGCTPECQIDAQCNDGDACTLDRCSSNGVCSHQDDPTLPGCGGCQGPQDCNDGRACTQDLCSAAGDCLNFLIPGCCESDGQCQDGDDCTLDRCDLATGACSHQPITSDACGGCDIGLCDDNNACTSDTCNSFTGGCDHAPIPGCCTANSQCADGDACTFDQCDNSVCTHTFLPLPGCQPDCAVDTDCEDGNPCTTNRCGPGGTCRINVIFGCCDTNADCVDNNACTSDTCYGQVGVCFNQQIGCNDNNACTTDSCDPQVGCTFTPISGCCTSAAQCNDGDACTSDGCAGGQCVHSPNDSCCASDADCVQPLCAQGTCLPDGQCIYDNCCEVGPDGRLCDDGDVCTDDVCGADGGCRHTIAAGAAGCCASDADCPADVDCTDWRCDQNQHQCVSQTDPSCCQEATVKSYAFPASGLSGWTIEPAQTATAVTWWVSNRRSTSPPSALYMGNPTAGNYDNGAVPKAYATTPSIALPTAPGIEMSFRVWLDIEQFQDFDPFFIDVLGANDQATTVWNKTAIPGSSYRSWVATKLNLTPWAGQTIRIRFRFEADDNLLNDTEGIYLDDVVIRTLCEPVSLCNSDLECNDGDSCTNDRCLAGVCQAQPIPGCCETTADCDDAYACTTDACVAGKCKNALIAGCCVAEGECNDGRACTADACDQASHSCVFIDTGGCCQTAADCQDGDSCTSDSCQPNGSCHHGANLQDPSCCEAGTFFTERFSISALTTFTVQADGSQVRWRVYNGQVFTAPFALYYGNPATHDFDSGARTFGTATSGDIAIPTSAHNAQLTFNVWLDVDNFPFDDLLSARIIVGGNAFTVWERTDLGFGVSQQWTPVTIDLPSQAAGRTIRVQLAFDSVDEQDNDGEGVYIDDVSVFAICP